MISYHTKLTVTYQVTASLLSPLGGYATRGGQHPRTSVGFVTKECVSLVHLSGDTNAAKEQIVISVNLGTLVLDMEHSQKALHQPSAIVF